MRTMLVDRPGMLSTLQDTGRLGHQQYGVSVNGPMDEWSHRVANALVGNPEDAAVLECTSTGRALSFSEHTLVALCGAAMNVTADGQPVPYGRAVLLRRGVVLDIGARTAGARLYLAVRGGLAPDPVLGSRSTNVRAGFGGFHGRPLRKGDHVPLSLAPPGRPRPAHRTPDGAKRAPHAVGPARGRGAAAGKARRSVARHSWPALERVHGVGPGGFRTASLQGHPPVRPHGHTSSRPRPDARPPDGAGFGSHRLRHRASAPDGQPIVLMRRPPEARGGYRRSGVASADLPLLAQAMPGDELYFEAITQADAENAWQDFEERLQHLRRSAAQALES